MKTTDTIQKLQEVEEYVKDLINSPYNDDYSKGQQIVAIEILDMIRKKN